VRDYLASPRPGADAGYVVVPRSLAEAMPLPWQQHMTYLLSEFHQAFSHVTWPAYRVVPSRYEKLVDLDEEQLAEVGALVEIDTDGEVVYRDRSGRIIEHPDQTSVLVACLDPIPPPQAGHTPHTPPPGTPQPGPLPPYVPAAPSPQPGPISYPARPPAQPPQDRVPDQPIIVSPEPPDTPPTGFPAPTPEPPVAPGQPFGPTGYQQRRPGGNRW
jgi:hypothetical protein